MTEKDYRHNIIKDIIINHRVESQEVLLDKLKEKKISLTQATLSRDLRSLKVAKKSDNNGYFYSINENNFDDSDTYIKDLTRGIISVTFSSNIGVIKTQIGHANSVALAIDNLAIPGILGTIAGDDTIFCVIEDDYNKDLIKKYLAGKIPKENK